MAIVDTSDSLWNITGNLYNALPRFGEFCSCCCLPLLPQLAFSLLATWERPYRDSLYLFQLDIADLDSSWNHTGFNSARGEKCCIKLRLACWTIFGKQNWLKAFISDYLEDGNGKHRGEGLDQPLQTSLWLFHFSPCWRDWHRPGHRQWSCLPRPCVVGWK